MANGNVERAVQELALACFNNNPQRAAQQLRQIPGEHAPRLLRAALRQFHLAVPFVTAEDVRVELEGAGLMPLTKPEAEEVDLVAVASRERAESEVM